MKKLSILSVLIALVLIAAFAAAGDGKTGKITGAIELTKGEPMTSGMVFFYKAGNGNPLAPEQYRIEPNVYADIDPAGHFTADLPEGAYYLEAVQRKGEIGPPKRGEYFLIANDTSGTPKKFTITSDKTLDIGTLSGASPYGGLDIGKVTTSISGIIFNEAGRPAENSAVFGYFDTNMSGRAQFVSDKTGKDGQYLLGLATGGVYFLHALDMSSTPPQVIGNFGGREPLPVTVKSGQKLNGIDLGQE